MRLGSRAFLPIAILLCLNFLFLVSCGNGEFSLKGAPELSNPDYVRTPPELVLAESPGTNVESHSDGSRSASIDYSNISKGYVGVSCTAPTDVKFKVANGEYEYNYDVSNDGRYNYFPLAIGNGRYEFTVFINIDVTGSQYESFLKYGADVVLESEQVPFTVPNEIVNYGADSKVVQLSYDITKNASSNIEVVQQIYYWISHNIEYNTDLASEIINGATGYQPDLDNILTTKKGICYDYAALAAAMFRANGIPCKLVMGDVKTEEGFVYHAWNYIWLDEVGMIAVKIPSTPEEWARLDLTFAAAGDPSIAQFIGDGTNYTDVFFH